MHNPPPARALFVALALVASPALRAQSMPQPSEEFLRGQQDGMNYGREVGRKKGRRDGARAGDRAGYAAGLRDAEHGIDNPDDPGQPPPGPPPSDPPPSDPPPFPDPTPDPPPMPPPDPTPLPPPDPTPDPSPDPPPPDPTPAPTPDPTDDPCGEPEADCADPEAPEGPAWAAGPDGRPMAPSPRGAAEPDLDSPEAEALARYPDLMSPRAAKAASLRDKVEGALKDPQTRKTVEYSTGFALGFAAGYQEQYQASKAEAHARAFRKGYARGQADWRRRNTDETGATLGPQGQMDRAVAEFQRGHYQEAADRFDMVLAGGQAGDLADDAMLGRARCLFRLKNFGECRGVLERLRTTLPDSPLADQAMFLEGASYEVEKKGGFFGIGAKPDLASAADTFAGLVRAHPSSSFVPPSLFRLGQIAERRRRKGEARVHYQRLVEQHPDHPLAAKARRRLESLMGARRRRR